VIRIRGLSKRLGRKQVLDGLDLEIPSGETWVIIGRSGTGKSVLLKHIIGLMKPDAGSIEIDGEDLAAMDESQIRHLPVMRGTRLAGVVSMRDLLTVLLGDADHGLSAASQQVSTPPGT